MGDFPRTQIENISLSRLIAGTNWFFGYSHTSNAKDALINETISRDRMADILEVFLAAGVDAVYGIRPDRPDLQDAIEEAENRVGRKIVRIAIPGLNVADGPDALGETERILDDFVAEFLDDVVVDVGLQQGGAHFAHRLANIFLGDFAAAGELPERIGKPIGQRAEHVVDSILRRPNHMPTRVATVRGAGGCWQAL